MPVAGHYLISSIYCKFGNFLEYFIFAKIKPLEIAKSLSFIDIGKSCPSREFSTSQICILKVFAKLKFSIEIESFRIYSL